MTNQEFEITNRAFVQAFNQGNINGVGSTYTKEATLLPPNSEMLKGRESIQAFWQGAMDMGVHDVALETLELNQVDDTAYEIGRYSLKIKIEGSESVSDSGKFIVIWKQEDGSWKWHIDIWNTNLPLQG